LSIDIISEYVAPWALPKEPIPFHLIWRSSIAFNEIVLEIPKELELQEFYNVDDYYKTSGLIIINKLKTSNFFGFVLSSDVISKELHTKYNIFIKFKEGDNTIYEHKFVANIFRPLLTVIDYPKIVQEDNKQIIKVKLRLSGFGKIIMKTDFSLGGKFIENTDSLFEEIARRILPIIELEDRYDEEKKIVIDEKYLANKTEEFINRLENGEFPDEIKAEDFSSLKEWLMDVTNKEKIKKLISKHVENLLIDSILYMLEKYPVEDVQMPHGTPKLYVEKIVQGVRFRIRFRYQDALSNDYEPLIMEIEFNEMVPKDIKELEIPINIEWEFNEINPNIICGDSIGR
jgi:hypothetical protein